MNVELTEQEMRVAAQAGVERRLRAIGLGRQHRYDWGGEGVWGVDIMAAAAELAVAKVLGRYWVDTAAPDSDGDVGSRVQVRWTARADGRLILHRTDPDDHAYVLVRGLMPTLDVAGWIYGRDGKAERFWNEQTGRPAFFVPAESLAVLGDRRAA